MIRAVPTAPWFFARAMPSAANATQRGSYSTPIAFLPRWMASIRVVPMPHIGSATTSPGCV